MSTTVAISGLPPRSTGGGHRTLSTRRSVRVPSGSTTSIYKSSYLSSTGSASRFLFSRARRTRMSSRIIGQITYVIPMMIHGMWLLSTS